MSSLLCDRVEKAIDLYEVAVDKACKNLRKKCAVDFVFIVVIPIILTIVAFVFSNVAGFTTLGLGSINATERLGRGHTALKVYWGESSKLEKSVSRLQIQLELCEPSDTVCVKKVKKLLEGYLTNLMGHQP